MRFFLNANVKVYNFNNGGNKMYTWKYVAEVAVFTLLASVIYVQLAHAEVDLTKAVIHHSASPDVSAKVIDQWHKQRGFNGIGYHFVIRQNGKIEKGRSLAKNGAHAKGRNSYIGICLTGYDVFTVAQVKSLITLLNDLGVNHIERHHEECPGKGLDLDYIRKFIKNSSVMVGKASYYYDTITANGEKFNHKALTCALKTKQYGKRFKVTNLDNGKSVIVRCNDTGILKPGRIIDLTPLAFRQLSPLSKGIVNVKIEVNH
jgi:hypothetical protein